jgi:hypothetical protein
VITLRRVSIGSAFKVGAVAYGVMFAIFGLFIFGFQALILTYLVGLPNPGTSGSLSGGSVTGLAAFGITGVLSVCCFYLIGIVTAALSGGISSAILAFAYNMASRLVGGLELELGGMSLNREAALLDQIDRDLRA